MSRPDDGQRMFFPSGNPFRNIFSKGSYLSPALVALLNSFEQSLAAKLKQLKPNDKTDILSLSWIRTAMELLCETHVEIKTLITDLQFPVSDWEEKWVDIYLSDSVKLLDVCIALSSELSRLNQSQLLLQYVLHVLQPLKEGLSAEQLTRAHSALGDWKQQIGLKNPKLDNCVEILHELSRSLCLAKVKRSGKGLVLMRAMFGLKVMTMFVCSMSVAALSGDAKMIFDLHVSEKFLWTEPFNEIKAYVNGEVKALLVNRKGSVLKEHEAINQNVECVYLITDDAHLAEAGSLGKAVLTLSDCAEAFAKSVDIAVKQVDGFFQILVTGRDALLCNLRMANFEQRNTDG